MISDAQLSTLQEENNWFFLNKRLEHKKGGGVDDLADNTRGYNAAFISDHAYRTSCCVKKGGAKRKGGGGKGGQALGVNDGQSALNSPNN